MSNRGWPPFAVAALLLAAPAVADDESAGVTPAPVRAEPQGSVTFTSADVVLDGDRVGVTLAVTARPGAALRLDLPRFGWLGEAETYPDRQFPELKVEVDGHAIVPAEEVSAMAGGRNITPALGQAGLDPFAIAQTPPFVAAQPGREPAFAALVASGAITKAPEGFLAGWTAARRIRVQPGAGAHVVTFRYKARPAFALRPAAAIASRGAPYCLGPAQATRVMAAHGLRGTVLAREYAIPVTPAADRPRLVTLHVAAAAGTATIVCGIRGAALIDPAGKAAVKPGSDGAVHLLRLATPG